MDRKLDHLARRQYGLLSTPQLHARGRSEEAIRHAVAEGELFVYRHAVYRTPGAPPTQEQAWLAAVLGAEPGTVLSHLSAAQAWRFPGFPDPNTIHLLTASLSQPRLSGVTGHRTIWLPDADRTKARGIPATTPERTFIDTCGAVSQKWLGQAGDELLRRRTMVLPRLVRTWEHIPVSGRRKATPMKAFFVEHVAGFDPGGSEQELDVMRTIRRAGLPLPRQQHRVRVEGRTYVLDYAWPAVLHCLEFYGVTIHGTPSAVHGDSERTRRLQRAGWTIWPVTSQTSANEIVAIAQEAGAALALVA